MGDRDVSHAHEVIQQCALEGVPASFAASDDPEELPAYDDDGFWEKRSVDGAWLADFLTSPDSHIHRRGVTIIGARIIGSLDLEAADLRERLTLVTCQFGEYELNLVDARTRSIRLTGTACGGFRADGAQIAGDLCLNRGFVVQGEVRLLGAIIGGDFECTAGEFANPGDMALSADRARIAGSVFLDQDFTAHGQVRLLGAVISGDFDCTAGEFANPGGMALSADRARIAGSLFFNRGFTSLGEVRLVGAAIGSNLDCTGGEFAHPGGNALVTDGAQIAGSMFLNQDFRAQGEVRLLGAVIGGNLDCTGGKFTNPDGDALSADGAQMAGAVFLQNGFRVEGSVVLTGASAGVLVDDEASWPEQIDLDGFRYERLYGPARGWRQRARWLRRQRRPSPQGYIQLASVYRASGDDHDARKILIERHNALLNPPEHWKSELPTGWRGFVGKVWRTFLRLTIGHGYEPWRVLWLAVPLVTAMSLWYAAGARHDLLIPTREAKAVSSHCTRGYTCLQPVVYTLDTLLPIIDLGQRARWTPDQSRHGAAWYYDGRWLAAGTWIMSSLGWILATLVAASFTQAIRRE